MGLTLTRVTTNMATLLWCLQHSLVSLEVFHRWHWRHLVLTMAVAVCVCVLMYVCTDSEQTKAVASVDARNQWPGIPDFGHGHIGHPASGHLTSDIWTYDTGEGKWTLDTWTLDTWTLDTCIFIFPHAYEHNSRSNYINKILLWGTLQCWQHCHCQ